MYVSKFLSFLVLFIFASNLIIFNCKDIELEPKEPEQPVDVVYSRYSTVTTNEKKSSGLFYTLPVHVLHYLTKEFVDIAYVVAPDFASDKDCRVFVQNSLICLEMYDTYVKVFDPDYTYLCVEKEFFELQMFSKDWVPVGYTGAKVSVVLYADGINITQTYDTAFGSGSFAVTYIIRKAEKLRHSVSFTTIAKENRFRVVYKLEGITAKDCNLEQVAEKKNVFTQKLVFYDGDVVKFQEDLTALGAVNDKGQWNSSLVKNISLEPTLDAKGCSSAIVLGDYNKSFSLDYRDSSSWKIDAGANDGYLRHDIYPDPDVYTYSSSATGIYVGRSFWSGSFTYNYSLNCLFHDLAVPAGATINNANISYTTDDYHFSGSVYTRIYAEHSNDPAAISDASDFLSRTVTAQSVAWTLPNGGINVFITSPNLTTVIQDVVEEAWWDEDDNLNIMHFDDGSDPTSLTAYRYLWAYDGSTTKCPILYIEWTAGGGVNYDVALAQSLVFNASVSITSSFHTALAQALALNTSLNVLTDFHVSPTQALVLNSSVAVTWDALVGLGQDLTFNASVAVTSIIGILLNLALNISVVCENLIVTEAFDTSGITGLPLNLLFYGFIATVNFILMMRPSWLGKFIAGSLFAFLGAWLMDGASLLDMHLYTVNAGGTVATSVSYTAMPFGTFFALANFALCFICFLQLAMEYRQISRE